jgi:hypothetical protein
VVVEVGKSIAQWGAVMLFSLSKECRRHLLVDEACGFEVAEIAKGGTGTNDVSMNEREWLFC